VLSFGHPTALKPVLLHFEFAIPVILLQTVKHHRRAAVAHLPRFVELPLIVLLRIPNRRIARSTFSIALRLKDLPSSRGGGFTSVKRAKAAPPLEHL
jgi:hypothetical protein